MTYSEIEDKVRQFSTTEQVLLAEKILQGLRESAPPVEAAPVKRLGEPAFWKGRPGLLPQMETAYYAITEAALALTLEE